MLLRPTPVLSTRFTFDSVERIYVAERSDLPSLSRVWDDSCDLGLTLISHPTGEEIVYAEDGEIRDGEGELQVTILRSAQRREDLPEIHLLND